MKNGFALRPNPDKPVGAQRKSRFIGNQIEELRIEELKSGSGFSEIAKIFLHVLNTNAFIRY